MEGLRIVLGLGNPGERYRLTRHNLGFRVVDRLAERGAAAWLECPFSGALVARPCGRGGLVLAKPQTYMNRSGQSARALCERYGADAERLLVVYDDADLGLGRLRIRPDGGAGGHNGIRSLIDFMETSEFARVRLGVRGSERSGRELADYVLDAFTTDEEPVADALVELAADAVECALDDGVVAAMNAYNGRTALDPEDEEDSEEDDGGDRETNRSNSRNE